MNDLNTLLDRAAGPATVAFDPVADLDRGHRALSRTRRRRSALGLVGVAAAGVVAVGGARVLTPQGDDTRARDSHHRATGVSLLSQPFEAGPYTFDQTPAGWEVQGSYPQGVTLAPVGFPDRQPLSFVGKLVIMFDANPPSGDRVESQGRTFWISTGAGYTTIAALTRAGEPTGVVRIQYPADTGWTRDTMLGFLAGVHVGAGARPAFG
jgi:hypothetical protein